MIYLKIVIDILIILYFIYIFIWKSANIESWVFLGKLFAILFTLYNAICLYGNIRGLM